MNVESPPPASPSSASTRSFGPLAGFGPVFTWGTRLSLRRKRFFLIAGAAVALGALVGYTGIAERASISGGSSDRLWYALWEVLDQGTLKFLLPLCALLFVTPGFSREVQQRTLVYHLVRPVSRTTVFLARFASGLVPAILVGTLMLWSVLWFSGLEVPASVWIAVAAVSALSAVLLGSLYYMLASIFRWGVIAGLIYTFVIEAMFSAARGSLQTVSMTYHVRSFYRSLVNEVFAERSTRVAREIDPDALPDMQFDGTLAEAAVSIIQKPTYESGATAVVTTLILATLFLAYGVWRTKRRDFPLKD